MDPIRVMLPARWAAAGSDEGQVGPHAASWDGRLLQVTPAPGTGHIEQVLATLFLDQLGDATPEWLQPWEDARQTAAAADEVIAVSGPTLSLAGATDRYLYCAGLAHRLLFERRWDHDRPGTCVWMLFNAGTGDLMQGKNGRRRSTPNRTNLETTIARTQDWVRRPPTDDVAWDECGSVTIVNLFSARSYDARSAGVVGQQVGGVARAMRLNHRTADVVLAKTFKSATAIVGAWGKSVLKTDEPTRPATVESIAADVGRTIHGVVCNREGRQVRWLTDMQPRYTLGMGGDAIPVPLEQLRTDGSLPLP